MAKIRSPRAQLLIPRPRLLHSFDAMAADGSIATVVAPGGWGKSALLADWARQAPLPVAWYALDRADRDMRRLVSGLCAAVDQALPGTAQSAHSTLDNGAPGVAVMGVLLGALEDIPLALVLDDFQHLDDLPSATALFDHFLRFRPQTLTLVLLSRTPPLPTSIALAGADRICMLNHRDLRFNVTEAIALLQAHGIDAAVAAQVATHADGWAVGLLLLARSAIHDEPSGRIDALMDHLGAEILQTLPPELRLFLLESAALSPITAADADAILGRCDSAALFAEVAARGLFLDTQDSLYRYHDLFAEYLVGILRHDHPDSLRTICHTASDWWTARGDLPRALSILAMGEEWEALAAMLDRERSTLWTRGLGGTVLTHMAQLPPAYHTPRLLTLCGYARSQQGDYAEALALADAGQARATNDEDWLSSALLRVQTLAYMGRYDEAIRGAEAALAVAHAVQHERAVTFLRELRGTALLHLGLVDEGRADLLAVLTAYEQNADEQAQARTCFNLATQLVGVGRAGEAGQYLLRADALWRRLDTANESIISDLHHSRAMLCLLTGDLRAARQEATQAQAVARQGGYPLLECESTATLAHICVDEGNAQEAEHYATLAAEMAARIDAPEHLNAALRARISAALLRRDRAGARRLIDDARPRAVTPYDHALLDLLDGTLGLRSGAHARAATALRQAAERLEDQNRPHNAARAYLLYAEALLSSGSVRRAEDALNCTASLTQSVECEGYLRPTARMTPRVLAERRTRRHLWRNTRVLLDRLAIDTSSLSVLPTAKEETTASSLLWLSPFGKGQIRLADRKIDPNALPAKARELLFFVGRAGEPLSRDVLLDAIWDGDISGGPALWDTSRHLRRLLGEHAWGREAGHYVLRVPVHDESRRFDALAAVAIADGAFMERLAAAEEALKIIEPGSYLEWCDGMWAIAERNRMTRQSVLIALTLAQLYRDVGRSADAIGTYRRAIALDPFDETARIALVQHLSACGQLAAARDEYKAYHRLLRDEMKVEPSIKMRAYITALESSR